VGSKSAQRFAFHILRSTDDDAEALADAVRGLKAALRLCSVCNNVTDVDPCAYCVSPTRNQRLVCVVEEPTSIAAVERARGSEGGYQGSITFCMALSRITRGWSRPVADADAGSAVERGEVDEVILATSRRWRRGTPIGWQRRCARLG